MFSFVLLPTFSSTANFAVISTIVHIKFAVIVYNGILDKNTDIVNYVT